MSVQVAAGTFERFANAVNNQFVKMAKSDILFEMDCEKSLFDVYLRSFPAGTNPMFSERTEHDCKTCKQFIRRVGHVISINDGRVTMVWDAVDIPAPYDVVADKMREHLYALSIKGVFATKEAAAGCRKNVQLREDGSTMAWEHFWCSVPSKFVSASPEAVKGGFKSAAQVFRRGLDDLSLAALETVSDLISSGSLYRGEEHASAVDGFFALRSDYPEESDQAKEIYVWERINHRLARFRNSVIGSLVVDISNGMSLESAVRLFEQKVAPANYKRPKAVITKRMVSSAMDTIRKLDLIPALDRRYAKLSDVSVNNVLFVDNAAKPMMKDGIESLLIEAVAPKPVKIDSAVEVSADEFLKDILPSAKSVDLLVESRHGGNFMSLTAPVHGDVKPLFRWDNNFAWSYDGDVADSIKARVSKAGGNVKADLRVSLAWFNTDDLDIHATMPNGKHVWFSNKMGILDVDMNVRGESRKPVENLAFNKPVDGHYIIFVRNYKIREREDVGFTIEVECHGQTRVFTSSVSPYNRLKFTCLDITMKGGDVVDIDVGSCMSEESASQDKWGIKTETLVKVDTIMMSPNHWDGQRKGNRHMFFILDGCRNPGKARGIYNEFLRADLGKHRRVFEVLGMKTKCGSTPDQLSGVGFSSTKREKATVIVRGNNTNRAYTICF